MARKRAKKPEPVQNEEQVILARDEEIWRLRARGYTLQRISEQVGLDRGNVSRHLARITARVAQELPERIIAVKQEQTAILEHMVDEALQEWARSRERAQKGRRTVTSSAEGSREEVEQTAEDQFADTRYLEAARAALADIRDIWGANAPKETILSGSVGGPPALVQTIEVIAPPEILQHSPEIADGNGTVDPPF